MILLQMPSLVLNQVVAPLILLFALHTVITKTLENKTKLYSCFIDYHKAFDSVNRTKLLYTLARSGVIGKLYTMFTIIQAMYNSLKTYVKPMYSHDIFCFFYCMLTILWICLRQ